MVQNQELYEILEDNDMSGTEVKKRSLIIKIKENLSEEVIKSIAKGIIDDTKKDDDVLFLYISDKPKTTIENREGRDLWNCIITWKKPESDYDVHRIMRGHMETEDIEIDGLYTSKIGLKCKYTVYFYEWNLHVYKLEDFA